MMKANTGNNLGDPNSIKTIKCSSSVKQCDIKQRGRGVLSAFTGKNKLLCDTFQSLKKVHKGKEIEKKRRRREININQV
jgi:hypothetical protein